MKIICRETYRLNDRGVDEASEKLTSVLSSCTELSGKEILRLRLSAEEILLNWMQTERESQVLLHVERRRRELHIILELKSRYPGVVRNPLKGAEEYGSFDMAGSIMASLGVNWMYQMINGVNQTFIQVPSKNTSQVVRMGVTLTAAAVTCLLIRLLPEKASEAALCWVVEPLFETFLGLLTAIVGPMVFLSVLCGILNIGSSKQVGSIGRDVFVRFLKGDAAAALFGGVLLVLFFPCGMSAGAGGEGQLKDILMMLYHIVPDNLVAPFISGNTLQIMFMAILIGTSMLFIQNQISLTIRFAEQCNIIIQQILTAIGRMIPAFIYLSVIRLMMSKGIEGLDGFVKMILLYLAGAMCLNGYFVLSVCRKLLVSPGLLIQKLLPGYLIGLTTASSTAAFSECTSTCVNRLGIKKALVDFGLPLGFVALMPNMALWMVLMGGACAEYYGRILTPADILMLLFIATFLAVAAPPVPGSGLTCYTILLMQMNLPLEMLAVAGAIDFIMDFTSTGGDVIATETELLLAASKLEMVDMKKLQSGK